MSFLLFLLSLFTTHIIFKKKDAFFILRFFGILISVSILVHFILHKTIGVNKIIYYILTFLLLSLIVTTIRYFKNRNFNFIKIKRQDFDWRSLLLFFILSAILWTGITLYYEGDFISPRYLSIDAPLHFTKVRNILEVENHLDDAVYAPAFIFYNLLPFKGLDTNNILLNFQIINFIIYSILSLYFFFLLSRFIKIKSYTFSFLAFFLVSFGFLFNLLITGFFPQLVGLLVLLFLIDFYPYLITKKWIGILTIGILSFIVLISYPYWTPVLLIFLSLDWLRNFIASKNKWRDLLKVLPLILAAIIIAIRYKGLTKVAVDEGEIYRVFLANFIFLTPFLLVGLYFILRKWIKDKTTVSSFIFSTFIFSLLLFFAYKYEFASSYTFAKNVYLIGPLIFYISVYGLDHLLQKIKLNNFKYAIEFIGLILVASIVFTVAQPKLKENESKLYEEPPLEMQVIKSYFKENMWSLNFHPLDIFLFNSNIYTYQKYDKMENFIYFDKTKLEFLEGLAEHLPDEYRQNYGYNQPIPKITFMQMIADFKTSKWFVGLSGIWNIGAAEPAVLADIVLNYTEWKKNNENPYLIILDTQAAKKWMWMNEKKFKWKRFEILHEHEGNYLLKFVGKKNKQTKNKD